MKTDQDELTTPEVLSIDSNRPLCERFLSAQLDQIEEVLRRGQEGKHEGRNPIHDGPHWHFTKADGHIVQMGSFLDAIDTEDTGVGHAVLAAIRLLFVDACNQSDEVDHG